MSKLIILLSVMAFVTACSTIAYHKVPNVTPDGVRVDFGSKDGVHVGDKVDVIENKCTATGRGGNRCKLNVVGSLTLVQIDEASSLAKPEGEVILKDGQVFKLSKHCEKNPEECK